MTTLRTGVFGAVPVLGLAGLAWVVWMVMFGLHRRQWSWSFLPAPMIVALALALLVAGVPLQARWAMSHGSFESPVFQHLGGAWYHWTASW